MENTRPKPFIFVLMPFDESFDDVYELGIKQACKDAGAYCERVDEQIFQESILERVYNQIAKADVIVAEMTGRNPNVFYECGYAHALDKQVILLTRNVEDIPFDLKHFPHIVYGGKISSLKDSLARRIRWCVEQPSSSLTTVDWQLELFIDGVSLGGLPKIVVADDSPGSQWYCRFNLAMYNPATRVIDGDSFGLAIVVPRGLEPLDGCRTAAAQPGGGYICNLKSVRSIFPNGWESLQVSFGLEKELVGEPISMVLRLFKVVGLEEFPFSIVVVRG